MRSLQYIHWMHNIHLSGLKSIELEAIILQEQPDQGLTVIEKFETYAQPGGIFCCSPHA
jgi:hypothetical protein